VLSHAAFWLGSEMNTACTQEACDTCTDRLVCHCLQVTESMLIETLTTRDVSSVTDLRTHTGAGEGCTACHSLLRKYIEQYA